MSTTPIIDQLEILGRKHAVSHFEKCNFLDSPNEEVQKWLDRNHIMTTQAEFDRFHDAYCKGFQSYHVEKWASGLSETEAADLCQTVANRTETPSPVSPAGSVAVEVGLVEEVAELLNPIVQDNFRDPVVAGFCSDAALIACTQRTVKNALSVLSRLGSLREQLGKAEGPSTACSANSDPDGSDVLPSAVLKESIEEFLDVMDRHHGRWFPASEDAVHEAILKLRNSIADHE